NLEEWSILGSGKNLFIGMVEKISAELNVSHCWVCGGTLMTERWPWRGSSLDPLTAIRWKNSRGRISWPKLPSEIWPLSGLVVGEECLQRRG
ncbi:ENR1 protein, partial [Mohoua ochrocephala]|nr:ENR1 protein [Mohoua ochrocephala]